jgi:ABC-type nickel/cobalt efflux system permease component RcnA
MSMLLQSLVVVVAVGVNVVDSNVLHIRNAMFAEDSDEKEDKEKAKKDKKAAKKEVHSHSLVTRLLHACYTLATRSSHPRHTPLMCRRRRERRK